MFRPFLAAVLLACSFPALAQQWVAVRSPHYTVITDADAKRASDIALRFEQLRAAFGTLIGNDKVHLPVPLQIVAFRSSQELATYAPRASGGYFEAGEDRSFLLLDLSSEDKWSPLYRDYAQQLLNGTLPSTPEWLDDGLVAYFSTFRSSANGVQFPGLAFAESGVKRPLITDLLRVTDRPGEGSTSAEKQTYALQSSLLVSYLIGRNRVEAAVKYFQLVRDGMSGSNAIRKAFDVDPRQLEADFAGYRISPQGRSMPTTIDSARFQTTAVDRLSARVHLAELRIASNDLSDRSVREFTDLITEAPNLAAAHRDAGYLYFLRGEFEPATEHLRIAVGLDPKDGWSNYYSALVTVRRSIAAGKPPQDVAALKQHLQIAIASIPDLADAYSLLSFADAVQGDNDAAVIDARKASELSPRNETYALNLARSCLAAGQAVEARDIFRQLSTSKNQAISFPAKQGLARAERVADDQSAAARHKIPETYDKPQWHRDEKEIEREPEKPVEQVADKRPVKYMQGQLLSVDCSKAPAATLHIKAGPRTMKMVTADSRKLLLLGADEFSCSWKNKKVLVNYKAGGKADGDLVSLEVQ